MGGERTPSCLSPAEQTCPVNRVPVVSGPLRVVLLVAVQLVWIVGGHVGEILENVLVGFVSCRKEDEHEKSTMNEQYLGSFLSRSLKKFNFTELYRMYVSYFKQKRPFFQYLNVYLHPALQ